MKRILCVIDSLGPGGAQRQLAGLARFLKFNGYDVYVVVYHDDRFYVDQLLSAGVPYVFLKKAKKGLFRQWHLMRYLCKANPDVVISYLEAPSMRSCVAHFFNRSFKLIVSERNTSQQTGCAEKIRFKLFRIADCIVPNAYAQEEYIKKNFPRLTPKLMTITNFVELQHFIPPEERKRRIKPEIIVVATIWQSKNTLGFIDAIKCLKDKGYDFHVSWYGRVDTCMHYFSQCQQKIDNLCIGDLIELKEKTTQIKEKYYDADYFCLPSFYEGTPNVICEAMASGLPIVCSNICDNGRYVVDGYNGFLFDPHNTQSIVNAMERMLLIDDKEYEYMCKSSRNRAEDLLSEERFVESYINLIER